ncbi:NUDIX hydrolase [Nocardioides rubriscoriae]|uniref:NUDIX hydrolase n=1 Tax=Nocardioides rubriscoriae TaxID=642762 RepID=UPI0011E0091C|nr:NUDIX domain-containing protein [Nocardioides rubriscoriae]
MTLHADALATLRAWQPPDAAQAALRDRYVAHLQAHPDALSRDCRPDHLTASTLVLSHDGTHVLLTLHRKARAWFQFGGHPEATDTTLAGAALREAVEESGLTDLALGPVPIHLDEHEVPFCGGSADGLLVHHLDVRFLAVAPAEAVPVVSDESLDVRWWPVDALPGDDLGPLVAAALAVRAAGRPGRPGRPGQPGQSVSAGVNSEGGVISAAADQPSR